MQVSIENFRAYFDFDEVHGSCEFEITNITDEDYDVEMSDFMVTQVVGEVELDYILTDVELNQLRQEIIWCIQETTLIEDMQHPEDDFDEDEWRYDA
jgi:hypothetical protein